MKILLKLLSFLFLLSLVSCLDATENPEPAVVDPLAGMSEADVLYIGNSQLYTYNVQEIVKKISASSGVSAPLLNSDTAYIGGATLKQIYNDKNRVALNKIETGTFEVLVLQGFYSSSEEELKKYTKLFDQAAKANGVKITVIFSYATREDAWSQTIENKHLTAAKDISGARKAFSNIAFNQWKTMTGSANRDLLAQTDGHPTVEGSYIYALSIYCAITGKSPVGLTGDHAADYGFLEPLGDQNTLQRAAWAAYTLTQRL
jgi:hypothetical protein